MRLIGHKAVLSKVTSLNRWMQHTKFGYFLLLGSNKVIIRLSMLSANFQITPFLTGFSLKVHQALCTLHVCPVHDSVLVPYHLPVPISPIIQILCPVEIFCFMLHSYQLASS